MRALAVLAVIIYHVDVNYLPGGFLGVDLFFVLSGYLISSLIIKEYRKTGSLNLYNFYIRRARTSVTSRLLYDNGWISSNGAF